MALYDSKMSCKIQLSTFSSRYKIITFLYIQCMR